MKIKSHWKVPLLFQCYQVIFPFIFLQTTRRFDYNSNLLVYRKNYKRLKPMLDTLYYLRAVINWDFAVVACRNEIFVVISQNIPCTVSYLSCTLLNVVHWIKFKKLIIVDLILVNFYSFIMTSVIMMGRSNRYLAVLILFHFHLKSFTFRRIFCYILGK